MASMEPAEDEISQVVDFTGLNPADDRALIIQALKSNGRNAPEVVNQFFENEYNFRQKYSRVWDDSVFGADRDGTTNQPGISFHIESPAQHEVIHGVSPPTDSHPLGAPSRPPSRSNSRSPLSGVVNWTTSSSGVPTSQAEEDEDVQRAIRESAQEAGIDMPETGIIDSSTSQPYFGPANRSDYEQSSWAMVPTGPAETRTSSAPTPSLRKRAEGAPAFLVQGISSAGDHRLGGLLSILHEIPLARNVLLETGSPAASYGHNGEWWKGQEILPPHVLAQLQTGQLVWGQDSAAKPDFDEELHRLMAFLDSTERSYGTVSVMTDLIPFSNAGAERQFYEQLGQRNGEKIQPLMNVASLAQFSGDGEDSEEARFGLLEMEHTKGDYDSIRTLYESLDHVMWNDAISWIVPPETSKMAVFKETSEIFTIKIGGEGPMDGFEIPEEFYPERWLESRQDEARRIQKGWAETKDAVAKCQAEEREINEMQDPVTHQVHNKKELLEKATGQWKEYAEYLQGLGRFHALETLGFQSDKYPDYRAVPLEMDEDAKERLNKVEETIYYSQQLLASLANRKKALNNDLEQIKARQRFLGRLLTVPDKSGRPKPMTCKKYLLRGVATATDVVYLAQRAEVDLIELHEAPKQLDQWWRLAYTPNEEQPVKAEKIEIERVFRDVWQETKTPLLVYATEDALNTPKAPLSSALERFVKAENKAFRQELNQEKTETHEKRKPGILHPLSPSKRKHRADSFDSMDSNRASLGSEDERSGFDNPFTDQDDGIGTEMTDMSETIPEFARSASVESAPALPARKPESTQNTSATMTPSTMVAETGDSEESPKDPTSQVEDHKAPEMKERARSRSPIITRSRSGTETKKPIDLMDMDIPENQA